MSKLSHSNPFLEDVLMEGEVWPGMSKEEYQKAKFRGERIAAAAQAGNRSRSSTCAENGTTYCSTSTLFDTVRGIVKAHDNARND